MTRNAKIYWTFLEKAIIVDFTEDVHKGLIREGGDQNKEVSVWAEHGTQNQNQIGHQVLLLRVFMTLEKSFQCV